MSNAFEVYVNGLRILRSGQVAPFVSYTTGAMFMERIPDAEVATGSISIALRLRILPAYWDSNYSPISNRFRLGQESALDEHVWLRTIGKNLLGWLNQFSGLGLAIVALALFAAQRRQKEYLWIFLWFFTETLRWPLAIVELFHTVPIAWEYANQCLGMIEFVFITLTYWAFLRIPFGRWIQALLALAAIGDLVGLLGAYQGYFGTFATFLALLPYFFLVAVVLPILLVIHFRRGNREAGILLVPGPLYGLITYAQILAAMLALVPAFAPAVQRLYLVMYSLQRRTDLPASLGSRATSLCLLCARHHHGTALHPHQPPAGAAGGRTLRRPRSPAGHSSRAGRGRSRLHRRIRLPARPAGRRRLLSGPACRRRRLLVVVGDVAGKGLPAAMLVSMLIGAIRTAATILEAPKEVLAQLNERLLGRAAGDSHRPRRPHRLRRLGRHRQRRPSLPLP